MSSDGVPEEPTPTGTLLSRPGDPDHLVAAQRKGHLSVEPVQANGRYVISDGHVMFLTHEENHVVGLAGSGLAARSGTIVGYYSATPPARGDRWTFFNLSAWPMGGNRVARNMDVIRAAVQAFQASGYGDVRRAFGR